MPGRGGDVVILDDTDSIEGRTVVSLKATLNERNAR
jgi:hypothetical protein